MDVLRERLRATEDAAEKQRLLDELRMLVQEFDVRASAAQLQPPTEATTSRPPPGMTDVSTTPKSQGSSTAAHYSKPGPAAPASPLTIEVDDSAFQARSGGGGTSVPGGKRPAAATGAASPLPPADEVDQQQQRGNGSSSTAATPVYPSSSASTGVFADHRAHPRFEGAPGLLAGSASGPAQYATPLAQAGSDAYLLQPGSHYTHYGGRIVGVVAGGAMSSNSRSGSRQNSPTHAAGTKGAAGKGTEVVPSTGATPTAATVVTSSSAAYRSSREVQLLEQLQLRGSKSQNATPTHWPTPKHSTPSAASAAGRNGTPSSSQGVGHGTMTYNGGAAGGQQQLPTPGATPNSRISTPGGLTGGQLLQGASNGVPYAQHSNGGGSGGYGSVTNTVESSNLSLPSPLGVMSAPPAYLSVTGERSRQLGGKNPLDLHTLAEDEEDSYNLRTAGGAMSSRNNSGPPSSSVAQHHTPESPASVVQEQQSQKGGARRRTPTLLEAADGAGSGAENRKLSQESMFSALSGVAPGQHQVGGSSSSTKKPGELSSQRPPQLGVLDVQSASAGRVVTVHNLHEFAADPTRITRLCPHAMAALKHQAELDANPFQHTFRVCGNPLCRRKWKQLTRTMLPTFCPTCRRVLEYRSVMGEDGKGMLANGASCSVANVNQKDKLPHMYATWFRTYLQVCEILAFPMPKTPLAAGDYFSEGPDVPPDLVSAEEEWFMHEMQDNLPAIDAVAADVKNWNSMLVRKKYVKGNVTSKNHFLCQITAEEELDSELRETGRRTNEVYWYLDFRDSLELGDCIPFLGIPNPAVQERGILPRLCKLIRDDDGDKEAGRDISQGQQEGQGGSSLVNANNNPAAFASKKATSGGTAVRDSAASRQNNFGRQKGSERESKGGGGAGGKNSRFSSAQKGAPPNTWGYGGPPPQTSPVAWGMTNYGAGRAQSKGFFGPPMRAGGGAAWKGAGDHDRTGKIIIKGQHSNSNFSKGGNNAGGGGGGPNRYGGGGSQHNRGAFVPSGQQVYASFSTSSGGGQANAGAATQNLHAGFADLVSWSKGEYNQPQKVPPQSPSAAYFGD